MPGSVTREELQRLVDQKGAQVVEVLPREEYDDEHIAGAIHMALEELDEDAAFVLAKDRPVVVYCNDFL